MNFLFFKDGKAGEKVLNAWTEKLILRQSHDMEDQKGV
jgi:hypothetical protein